MKRAVIIRVRTFLCGVFLALAWQATGQETEETEYEKKGFLQPYDVGSWNLPIPVPAYTNSLNSFLPENSGGYVAVWDLADSRLAENALVERRDSSGNLIWSWSPPEPKPDPLESTRAVMAGRTHVLWASSQRWFYLNLADGSVTRSNEWSLPYLDATRLVPQNDLLYVIYQPDEQLYASVYTTNMEQVGTLLLNWPPGYWRAYAGAWMVDLSQRTNRTLRVARLGPALSVLGVSQISFASAKAGGYIEHRVLGANTNGLFVASSLNWPDYTITYFTYLNADGTVAFQHQLIANQMITGVAVLTNGWLVSAQTLGDPMPRHVLYRVGSMGRPHSQITFASDPLQQNVMLNTSPPRLLRLINSTPWEQRAVELQDWKSRFLRLLWKSQNGVTLYWDSRAFDISGIIGDTNYFWREPVRLNNT